MPDEVDMADSGSDISDEDEMGELGGRPVHSYVQDLFSDVIVGLKASNDLPSGDDYDFYKSFRQFPKVMHEYSAMLMSLVDKVSSEHTQGAAVDTSEALTDLVETLFESIDSDLDAVKHQANAKTMSAEERIRRRQLLMAVQSVRPQNNFTDKPDNSSTPFRCFVKDAAGQKIFSKAGVHPYEPQIRAFAPKPWQLETPQQSVFLTPEEVKCTYIEKASQLEKLASHLLTQREFAVDLEHHSMNSFQGFLCLMQISTRQQDYIIDCIALRDHMHVLLGSFANEDIMKVLHGASSDIEWLQRDFGLYIVNMFDTGAAAQQLGIPHGLGKLLATYGIHVDKKYQTADWRQRPLSADMLKYARLDTHYLLVVADKLRLALLQMGPKGGIEHPLRHVYNESNALCLRQYKKPSLEDDEMRLMGRIDAAVRARHESELKLVLEWRDEIARKEDESYHAVLPNATCISLAQEVGTIDLTKSAICKLFTPTPPLLQKHIQSLIQRLQATHRPPAPATQPAAVSSAPKNADDKTVTPQMLESMGWGENASVEDLWELEEGGVSLVEENSKSGLYRALARFVNTDDRMQGLLRHFGQVKREAEQRQAAQAAQAAVPKHDAQAAAAETQPGSAAQVLEPFTNPEDPTSLVERGRKKKKASASEHPSPSEAKRCKKSKGTGKLPHEKAPQTGSTPLEFLKNIGWTYTEDADLATATPSLDSWQGAAQVADTHAKQTKKGGVPAPTPAPTPAAAPAAAAAPGKQSQHRRKHPQQASNAGRHTQSAGQPRHTQSHRVQQQQPQQQWPAYPAGHPSSFHGALPQSLAQLPAHQFAPVGRGWYPPAQ